VSQSNEFCCHNPLCSFSTSVIVVDFVITQSGNFWLHPCTIIDPEINLISWQIAYFKAREPVIEVSDGAHFRFYMYNLYFKSCSHCIVINFTCILLNFHCINKCFK
jgi:hypothetical protein